MKTHAQVDPFLLSLTVTSVSNTKGQCEMIARAGHIPRVDISVRDSFVTDLSRCTKKHDTFPSYYFCPSISVYSPKIDQTAWSIQSQCA